MRIWKIEKINLKLTPVFAHDILLEEAEKIGMCYESKMMRHCSSSDKDGGYGNGEMSFLWV